MARADKVWQKEEISKRFLDGVRQAIPFTGEQIELMLRIIRKAKPNLENFIDLGCGDAILGSAILKAFEGSFGTFIDFSETMITAANKKLAGHEAGFELLQGDFANKSWLDVAAGKAPYDLIVSGLAIHHQPHKRKKELYKEIFDLLTPGGLFLNLEHVAPEDPWVEEIFWDEFIQSVQDLYKSKGIDKTIEEINMEFEEPKRANILAPLEDQLTWLREIGFIHVDCYIKYFEHAMFGGVRP
ncbi:hypothetical protein MNBD_NITROSPINAE02-1521 [hydrothermal vent metagenome]|uniref:Methyltransferase domain-containing protein n=1 Tax=hydrothermal vent metagenome TaxID=652676 RepID=A0A3B1C9T4_9ZZZZ